MTRALAISAFVVALSCGPSSAIGQSWSGETGIYGTYDHFGNPPFGPPSFLCGVGFDLRYHGALPLDSVDVAVRYPAPFVARVGSPPAANADGWVSPVTASTVSSAHPTPARPSDVGHVSGTVGTVCPNGAADLDSLKAALVRIRWSDRGVGHEEVMTVDRVRGNVRVFAGDLSNDGLPRLEWER